MIPGNVLESTQRLRRVGVIAVVYICLLSSCGSETAPAPRSDQAAAESPTPISLGVASTEVAVLVGPIARIDSTISAALGRWILINVWATWCRPCVAETPELVSLHESLRGKPFSVIGISADYMTVPTPDEALKKVRKFVAEYGIKYPNVIFSGSTDELTARFALGGTIPTSILYDPQGNEVERWTGRLVDEDFARIASLIP